MRNFSRGVIVTLIVLVVGGLAFALLGFMPTNADATPPHLERRIAARALDASMEHHAPRVNNPVQVTDENLIDGMKLYTMNCALCHGALDRKPSRSEEHTSELQSRSDLVCRLLLEKKKNTIQQHIQYYRCETCHTN